MSFCCCKTVTLPATTQWLGRVLMGQRNMSEDSILAVIRLAAKPE